MDLVDDDDQDISVPQLPAPLDLDNVLLKFTNCNTAYMLPINPYSTDGLMRLKPTDPWQFDIVPDDESVNNMVKATMDGVDMQVFCNLSVTITAEQIQKVTDGKKVPAPAVNLYLQMAAQIMDLTLQQAFRGAGKSPQQKPPYHAWAMDDTAWSVMSAATTASTTPRRRPYPFNQSSGTFMAMETIFIPVSSDEGYDWTLLMIHPRRRLIEILPPSPETTESTIVPLQSALITNSPSHWHIKTIAIRCNQYLKASFPEDYNETQWGYVQTVAETNQDPPRYDESDDGGIILMLNAELIARGLAPHLLGERMRSRLPEHRRRIAYSLAEQNTMFGPIVSSTKLNSNTNHY